MPPTRTSSSLEPRSSTALPNRSVTWPCSLRRCCVRLAELVTYKPSTTASTDRKPTTVVVIIWASRIWHAARSQAAYASRRNAKSSLNWLAYGQFARRTYGDRWTFPPNFQACTNLPGRQGAVGQTRAPNALIRRRLSGRPAGITWRCTARRRGAGAGRRCHATTCAPCMCLLATPLSGASLLLDCKSCHFGFQSAGVANGFANSSCRWPDKPQLPGRGVRRLRRQAVWEIGHPPDAVRRALQRSWVVPDPTGSRVKTGKSMT